MTTPAPAQSLARGAAGIALLHIERAHAGLGSWDTAHAWLSAAVRGDLSAGPNASLFFGAPAVAFAVHAAAAGTGWYGQALTRLDAAVAGMVRRRLDQASSHTNGFRPIACLHSAEARS